MRLVTRNATATMPRMIAATPVIWPVKYSAAMIATTTRRMILSAVPMFGFILGLLSDNRWSLQRSLGQLPDKQHQPRDHGEAQHACQDQLHVLGHGRVGGEMARCFFIAGLNDKEMPAWCSSGQDD